MKTLILTGIALVALAAGIARSQEPKKLDMHAMMAQHDKTMMSMEAADKRLDDLVSQLNAAKGNDRIDKLAAVVNELVTERKQMRAMMEGMMKEMHGGMMPHSTEKKSGDDHSAHHPEK
jgi:uncharacterized coiled-coil protein SlyX